MRIWQLHGSCHGKFLLHSTVQAVLSSLAVPKNWEVPFFRLKHHLSRAVNTNWSWPSLWSPRGVSFQVSLGKAMVASQNVYSVASTLVANPRCHPPLWVKADRLTPDWTTGKDWSCWEPHLLAAYPRLTHNFSGFYLWIVSGWCKGNSSRKSFFFSIPASNLQLNHNKIMRNDTKIIPKSSQTHPQIMSNHSETHPQKVTPPGKWPCSAGKWRPSAMRRWTVPGKTCSATGRAFGIPDFMVEPLGARKVGDRLRSGESGKRKGWLEGVQDRRYLKMAWNH